MNYTLFKKLYEEGLISESSFQQTEQKRLNPLISVFWEIRMLLYAGIVLLTTGVGILIYENIDSIGHSVIVGLLALLTAGCFGYCFKHKKPYSHAKVPAPNAFFDYILLLGTLSLLTLLGYLQFQYQVFGQHYGMATFMPMLLLFSIAYSFDHLGILSLAIVNLGLWMGISVTPQHLLDSKNFESPTLIFTYLGFGLLQLLVGWLTHRYIIKRHFAFTYQHFGIHISFIALLAGYFYYYNGAAVLWLLGVVVLAVVAFVYARKQHNFYFLLLAVLYGYLALCCLIVRGLISINDGSGIPILVTYFPLSAVLIIRWLINLHKLFKAI
ncbi:hypothetical protein GCM10027037_32000 [Mucilaginibacter koreensis]